MKLLIIVPAYNEGQVVADTLRRIRGTTRKLKQKTILVVDDGSTDDTVSKARQAGVKVIRHIINRGLGGALGTGLTYAKKHGYDVAITLDADGQHDPRDIVPALKPISSDSADVVIGSRVKSGLHQIPTDRKILLMASNLFTWAMYGQFTTDSQSGFRVFNRLAIEQIRVKTERMEVSSEFFSEIKRLKLRLAEVPIKVIYTPYSRTKGQTNTNAFNIIYKLIVRSFR